MLKVLSVLLVLVWNVAKWTFGVAMFVVRLALGIIFALAVGMLAVMPRDNRPLGW